MAGSFSRSQRESHARRALIRQDLVNIKLKPGESMAAYCDRCRRGMDLVEVRE
jgi:hypothetical protein